MSTSNPLMITTTTAATAANRRGLKSIQNQRTLITNKSNALAQSTNTLKLNNNQQKDKRPLVSIKESENNHIDICKSKGPITRSRIPRPLNQTNKQQTQKQQQTSRQQKTQTNLIKFSSFVRPADVENIDLNDHTNVQLAPEFSNDIYVYLYHLEEKCKIKSTNFLQRQDSVNERMRARLVDWIAAVHHKFKLLPETLYLTVAIMDRFLESVIVTKDKVQLVGLTAFFIACKYEEIYPPELADFLGVCDAYSKNEILKMEQTILRSLNFNLSYPLPLHFLRRFSKAAHADQEIHTLAKYLMELGLIDYECSSWKPSLLAAVSLYLTLHILSDDDDNNDDDSKWTKTLAYYTNYKENELQPYVSTLCKVLMMTRKSKLQTINKKYSSFKLMGISESPKLMCNYVLMMSEKYL